MASSRKPCASDEAFACFCATESSIRGGEQADEYTGVDLAHLRDDESPQEVTDDADLYCVIFCIITHDCAVRFHSFFFRCIEEMSSFE